MSVILKVMSPACEAGYDQEFSVHADLSSVGFVRQGGHTFARCYRRDAVKTAQVPGFVEHEVLIDIPGVAYVMNEDGRTISTFQANSGMPLTGAA